VVQAEAMPAAMIECGSCSDRCDLGSLPLESHLSEAECEVDQYGQCESAEDPEQAGDDAEHRFLADGLPDDVDDVSDRGFECGGRDHRARGCRRGYPELVSMRDPPQAHDGDDSGEEECCSPHRESSPRRAGGGGNWEHTPIVTIALCGTMGVD